MAGYNSITMGKGSEGTDGQLRFSTMHSVVDWLQNGPNPSHLPVHTLQCDTEAPPTKRWSLFSIPQIGLGLCLL